MISGIDTTPNPLKAGPAWLPFLANAIRALDSDDCPRHLTDAVRSVVAAESAMVLVYRAGVQPTHVFDTFSSERRRRGLMNYIEKTYVLNPVYIAAQRGLKGGVCRIADLAPDEYLQSGHYRSLAITLSDTETLGYVTDDWPRGMDELAVILELPGGEIAEISLIRSLDARGGFTGVEIDALGTIVPVISAVFCRYWGIAGMLKTSTQGSVDKEQAFERFGEGILSPRECEVARLILRGHSGNSIADQLSISSTTVKSHRKNLYTKLGIATHFELFSLFLAEI